MKKLRFKQLDISDCGAACLASVASFYGLRIPVSRIRQYSGTDQKGTNLLGLSEAAEKMKLLSKAVRISKENIDKVPLPAIAHLLIKGKWYHFVVVYKAGREYVRIMDPASGSFIKKNKKEFFEEWTGILLILAPGDDFEKKVLSIPATAKLAGLFKSFWPIMTQSLVGAILYSLLGITVSIYVEKLVDVIIPSGNKNLLNLASIIVVIILLTRVLTGYLKSLLVLKTGQKIDALLVLGYYRHILKLPQRFFNTMRTGEIISRINDAVKVRNFINNTIIELFVSLMIVLVTLIFMAGYSFQTTIVVFASIPIYYIVYMLLNRVNKKTVRLSMEQSAEFESHLVESIKAQGTIRRFGLEEQSTESIDQRFVRLLKTTFKINRNYVLAGNFSEIISGLALIVVFWTGSMLIFRNRMTVGELLSFYALFNYLSSPLATLLLSNKSVQDALIATDRLFQIIDLEQEEEPAIPISASDLKKPDIEIINLKFKYQGQKEILENINLTIEAGSFVALIGESGSGKSTLLSLIQKIERPTHGMIKIAGADLLYHSKKTLNNYIASVPQDIILFSGTIASNIALGEYKPDTGRLLRLIEELGMTDFLNKLPNGLLSVVNENGNSLSGGERQKIAIARAMYKNPAILILDEASSSLDYQSENFLISVIEKFRADGKTIIMAAHRLRSVTNCDKIFILKNGKVEAFGCHDDLINNCEYYQELWNNQYGRRDKIIECA
jgi:ATP-binding cassette subfamily B protein